jgi:hypothetical protein
MSSSVPKVVNVPSYLTLHEPSRRFLENPFYFRNLLSYDGYLTIADSLKRFVADVCFGVGRIEETGFYYNSPQASTIRADLASIAARDRLRVVYVGTNWDRRLPGLMRALDSAGFLRIHGPVQSWEAYGYEGTKVHCRSTVRRRRARTQSQGSGWCCSPTTTFART